MTLYAEWEKWLEEIPAPPWFAAEDRAEDCPAHKNSGLALVDTGRSGDWPIARLCEWQTAEFIAKSPERIRALLDQLAETEARAMRLEFLLLHYTNRAFCEECAPGGADKRHSWEGADWLLAAKQKLRGEK